MSAPEPVTTLLDGRVRLVAGGGLPPTTDTVLLAAATPAIAGSRVLEAGCGSGAASLCLAARVPGCLVTAIEREPGLAETARENVAANGLAERIAVVTGDVAAPPAPWPVAGFDLVMSNPPYLEPARVRASPDPLRAAATVESMPLGTWLRICCAALRDGGDLVIVHRADRLDDLLAGLPGLLGSVTILPLWPDAGGQRPVRRILLKATRGGRAPLVLLPGFALHEAGGAYSAAAQTVFRGCAPVSWGPRA
ncbi:MAG: methyltransferase [Proteobacteria bacterium]|nr:methyltransferase [Pseudomonadota bacterium]